MPFLEPPQQSYLTKYASRPYWINLLMWNLRNLGGYISDKLRTDKMEGVDDWNSSGGWLFIRHKSGLPFLSYRAPDRNKFPWIEGYVGWRPNGAPGIALRRADAKGY